MLQTKDTNHTILKPKEKSLLDTDYIKTFYNTMSSAWPKDYYNVYTKKFLINYITSHLSTISSNSKILNAGSGGTVYNIPGTFYHLDIAENRIKHLQNYTVGSIEKLPYKSNFFDYIICVGTVINYAQKVENAFQEFNRVLKTNGKIIVEYERCHSGLIPAKDRNQDKFLFLHEYFDMKHENYLYSDKFINNLLSKNNFSILQQTKFQSILPLIAQITMKETIMKKWIHTDYFFRKIPFLNSLSHNRILYCKKTI